MSRARSRRSAESPPDPFLNVAMIEGNLPELLEGLERRIVLECLSRHEGNQSACARQLGLTESGLRYKLKRWHESGDSPSAGE